MEQTGQLYEKFLDEYVSEDAVRKYTTETAGYGITYLLGNDYARIYLDTIECYLRTSTARPLRLLEFGCGGGMNITRLVSLLESTKVPVECAYGTDFSPRLVQAEQEAKAFLSRDLAGKLSFHVARNEKLVEDLVSELRGKKRSSWLLRRYCWRQHLPILPSPRKGIGLRGRYTAGHDNRLPGVQLRTHKGRESRETKGTRKCVDLTLGENLDSGVSG